MNRFPTIVILMGMALAGYSQNYHIKYTGFYKVKDSLIGLPVNYHLYLDDGKSKFYAIEQQDALFDENSSRVFYSLSKDQYYYYDAKSSDLLVDKSNLSSHRVLLKNAKVYEWKITNETTIINGLTCYKALGRPTQRFRRSTDKATYSTTVWFAPEFNLPFGPGLYVDLPGLVVQASDFKNRGYTIKSIEKKEGTSFNWPKADNAIDFLEYYQTITKKY